jgi:cytochrome c oxidase subunit 2
MINWWNNLDPFYQQIITIVVGCAIGSAIGYTTNKVGYNPFNKPQPKADFAESWQLSFQDPASPIMEGIINLHHDIMFILVFVAVFVITVMYFIIVHFEHTEYTPKFSYEPLMHNTKLEFIWTLVPCLILMLLAMPSFALIYSLDDMATAKMTIKVIGHQWYWTYEYGEIADDNTLLTDPSTQKPKNFDSYMISEDNLEAPANAKKLARQLKAKHNVMIPELRVLRLLEVDNRLILPWNEHIRIMITSTDVLHSWAVPSLGIKMDACPGRLNQVSLFINRPGIFYGQCSEICGINHAFMPICIETA